MDSLNAKLLPLNAEWLSRKLQENEGEVCCLIDIRPSSQHCCKHIKTSENVNFNSILLRRLMKGVVGLDTHISDPQLVETITTRDPSSTKLILYDSCSSEGCVRAELQKHAEVLYKTNHCQPNSTQVFYLDGGFSTFSKLYPSLCESSTLKTSHSPIGISVSASLPLNFGRSAVRLPMRAQTPLEDESSQFGPPVEILPHLVLGCARDSSNLSLLRRLGVTAVLNVSHNCASHFKELFEYKIIPVQDSHHSDLLSHLSTAFDFINSIKAKSGKVFVHCHAGISRSATVCIAYIMKHMEMCLTKSYDFVKQKRPCIAPNLHFMGQLLEFERQLQEASTSKDSPLFAESPAPMDVQSIPVSISTVPQDDLPKIRDRKEFDLKLSLKLSPITESKRHLKRTFNSVSAPSSIHCPTAANTDGSSPSSAKMLKTALELPPFNCKFYSSTDGLLYPTKTMPMQTNSLPATPVNHRMEPCFSGSCRTQQTYSNAQTMESQFSPCRVVTCNGVQYI